MNSIYLKDALHESQKLIMAEINAKYQKVDSFFIAQRLQQTLIEDAASITQSLKGHNEIAASAAAEAARALRADDFYFAAATSQSKLAGMLSANHPPLRRNTRDYDKYSTL